MCRTKLISNGSLIGLFTEGVNISAQITNIKGHVNARCKRELFAISSINNGGLRPLLWFERLAK